MVQFQKGDLAVAQLKEYPLSPVRIVSITNREKSTPKFVVFCHGSHDFQTVVEANLLSYDIKRLKTLEVQLRASIMLIESLHPPLIFTSSFIKSKLQIAQVLI